MAESWAHQAREEKEGRSKRSRALFWSMRTGKSKAVIDKASLKFAEGEIEGVIVFAPNGVHLNWATKEIPRWHWTDVLDDPKVFSWSTPQWGDPARQAAFEHFLRPDGRCRYFTVNMEALHLQMGAIEPLRKFVAACNRRVMLVISEAHHFGHAGSKRTAVARNLARIAPYIMLETGTPALESPLRLYAMGKILLPDGFEAISRKTNGAPVDISTYNKFIAHFAVIDIKDAEKIDEAERKRWRVKKRWRTVVGYKNLDELREIIAPFTSVVLRSDCEDMPPLLNVERFVVMSEKQRKAYLELASHHVMTLRDGEQLSAPEAAIRMIKLQQILNGYVKNTETDQIEEIDAEAPIYDATVAEIVGTMPGKCLVWCRFHEDIRRMAARLHHDGIRYTEYHGRISVVQREKNRLAFNSDPELYVCLGQPAAGAEGLDFSGADAVVFFSSTPRATHVKQGQERATVMGGKAISVVRMRTPGTVDDRNWDIADGKITLSETLTGRGLQELLEQTDV